MRVATAYRLLQVIAVLLIVMQGKVAAGNGPLSDKEVILEFVDNLLNNVPLSVKKLAEVVPDTHFKKTDKEIVTYDTYIGLGGKPFIKEIEIRMSVAPDSEWKSHTTVMFKEKIDIRSEDIVEKFGGKHELVMPTPRSPSSVPIYYKYTKEWGSLSFGISRNTDRLISIVIREE